MSVDNDNNVSVKNFNFQVAVSGDAKVKNNTSGGNASSGNASTSNSTCTSIQITNGGSGGASNNNPCSGQNGGGEGGGNTGGTTGQNGGGLGAGQVLGANTIASLSGGGFGAGFATLPNTGLREGVNNWLVISILTIAASIGYWSKVIAPRLKEHLV